MSFGAGQFAGTPAYMAPELFQKKAYDEKVDIFAFGTLIWEVMAKKIPYEGYEVSDIKNKCLNDEKLNMPKSFSSEIIEVINSCRSLDPNKRPSFDELANKF
jgi:serine/threonine protein kinase